MGCSESKHCAICSHQSQAEQVECDGDRVGDGAKGGFSVNLTLKLMLLPSVLAKKSKDKFEGRIVNGAKKKCYVSFPGKYPAAWRRLIDEGQANSVACVYLTEGAGFGEHVEREPDKLMREDPNCPKCHCPILYGLGQKTKVPFFGSSKRNCKTYGYLKIKDTDVTKEQRDLAWKAAEEEMMKNKRCPAWGCRWFEDWKKRVKKAIEKEQTLVVVYFTGHKGKGEVQWDSLAHETTDLWDGEGLGGSQKGEVAWLRANKHEFEEEDMETFLQQFSLSNSCASPCLGSCTGATREVNRQWKKVREALPASLGQGAGYSEVSRQRDSLGGDISPTLTLCIRGPMIKRLQELRDRVLTGELEMLLNASLASEQWNLRVDCSDFARVYEQEVLCMDELTEHQAEKLQELGLKAHLTAPAGAGKTFVAVGKAVETWQDTAARVLFISRNEPLCRLFIYWMHLRLGKTSDLGRLHVLHGPEFDEIGVRKADVENGSLELTPVTPQPPPDSFSLVIVDEAHHIYEKDLPENVKLFTDKAYDNPSTQLLLLSDLSQSLGKDLRYPNLKTVRLEQVVRSTRTLVDACTAFGLNKSTGVCHHASKGPCVKSFLFPSTNGYETFEKYAKRTARALREVVSNFPDLDLTGRVAILVPNAEFRAKLKAAMEDKEKTPLECELPLKKLQLDTAVNSLARLRFGANDAGPETRAPESIIPDAVEKPETKAPESIILDSMENFDGMEKLIVIGVGLDIDRENEGPAARSLIYRAMSRANLLFLIVNEYVAGGWLEFLAHVELEDNRAETGAQIVADAAGRKLGAAPAAGAGAAPASANLPKKNADQLTPGSTSDTKSGVDKQARHQLLHPRQTPLHQPLPPDAADVVKTSETATSTTKEASQTPSLPSKRTTQSVFDPSGNEIASNVRPSQNMFDPHAVGAISTLKGLRSALERWVQLQRALEKRDVLQVLQLTATWQHGDEAQRAARQKLEEWQPEWQRQLREAKEVGPLDKLLKAWPFSKEDKAYQEAEKRLKALRR